jgi:hypothetical protein
LGAAAARDVRQVKYDRSQGTQSRFGKRIAANIAKLAELIKLDASAG